MTLKQICLFPASHDDTGAMLGTFELVAGCRLQLGEIVRAEIRQRMPFEPSPQILDRIQVGRVRRQISYLDVPAGAVQIVPHQLRPVRLEAIPDNQERSFEVSLELPS